ncbi:MAG: GMC family oxidoreductase, partial [Pseudomonadota bacterium]
LGRMRVELPEAPETPLEERYYGAHHIGTTRMAASPREGVVDADARVHEVANLYVAGSAIFPTCGWQNPTLTIAATSLKLAEHLKSVAT